jgi:hypothetical protein
MFTSALFTNQPIKYNEAFDTYGTFADQLQKITSINNAYVDISGSIVKYNALKNTVEDANKYPDSDFSGNKLAYIHKKSTVKDAVKEDIHTMIMQQNNSYIIGMIAISTVLITTYLLTKK